MSFATASNMTAAGAGPGTTGNNPPAGLPDGYFKQVYSITLQSSFGTPPYSYALLSGGLPPGVNMNGAGVVSGKPVDTGAYEFQVQVTDSGKPKLRRNVAYRMNVGIGIDMYGGFTALPSPKHPSGFFHMEKQAGRWTMVSPLGNAFYVRSVFNANEGFIEAGVLKDRYNNDMELWAAHRGQRMLSWGFNALGEYTAYRGLPVGTWGGKSGNAVKLPFILLFTVSSDLLYHPKDLGVAEPIKDIMKGIPTSTYNDYRGILLDFFDPKWQQGYVGEVAQQNKAITGGFAGVPWIIGITTEDADYLWALKGTGNNPNSPYPHPAWLVAVANFQQSGYQDTQVYSKYAWVSYLQSKYTGIAALNAAWGSTYTSFGDQGGYGTGTGVLDEDGRHTKWMGKDPYMLTGETSALKADMDAFLYQYVYQMESAAVKAIRSSDSNHLIFGPSALGGVGDTGVRPQVLKALADAGLDVLAIGYDPLNPQNVSTATGAYDMTGKPVLVWYGVTANKDSYWYKYSGNYHGPDYATQEVRGQHYASDQTVLYGAKATNGDHPILGIDFWSLTDSGLGEATNWGLLSDRDNAYNGKEAISAPGKDPWGFPTGGEDRNYGNSIDTITRANINIARQFIVEKTQ